MNILPIVIASSFMAIIAIICGLKLFEMNSSLSDYLRKFSIPIAILISAIVIITIALPEASATMSGGALALLIGVAVAGYIIVEHELSICRQLALFSTESRSKKAVRRSRLSFVTLNVIDIIGSVLDGAAIGAAFMLSRGAGIITMCAIVMFNIMQRVVCIRRYIGLNMSRGRIILNQALSLIAMLVTINLVYLFLPNLASGNAVYLAVSAAYLLYLSLWHLFFIVKSRKK